MGQKIIQLRRSLAHEMRKYLSFLLSGQVGAWGGSREIELGGIAGVLCHGRLKPDRVALALPVNIARSGARVKQPGSAAQVRPAQLRGTLAAIDDDTAHKYVVQQPATVVEEGDQQRGAGTLLCFLGSAQGLG
jgi:hypothetical protein